MIDCDTERRPNLVLTRVELANAAGVVVHGTHHGLQRTLDGFGHTHDLRFVFGERQHRDLDGSHRMMQFENDPGLAFFIRLL